MFYYFFLFIFLCMDTSLQAAHTQIASYTKTSTTTGVRSPDIFSKKSMVASATEPLASLEKSYPGYTTGSSQANHRARLSSTEPTNKFAELPTVLQSAASSDNFYSLNTGMSFEQALGFALVIFLSSIPWVSLHYEFVQSGHIPQSHLAILALCYMTLTYMYYQFFSRVNFTLFTLLKRATALLLSVNLIAQFFTYQQPASILQLNIPGGLFPQLSINLAQARLIFLATHFIGGFFAGYFAYSR